VVVEFNGGRGSDDETKAAAQEGDLGISEDLGVFKGFFKSRLTRFFAELKQDTLTHFGDGLQAHAKKQLASLQLLVRPSP
jgi:hypothetical protein